MAKAIIKDKTASFKISDFEVGETYQLTTHDWESPLGDPYPGQTYMREIMEPATAENSSTSEGKATSEEVSNWNDFLRIKDTKSGSIHLIHFDTIKASLLMEK